MRKPEENLQLMKLKQLSSRVAQQVRRLGAVFDSAGSITTGSPKFYMDAVRRPPLGKQWHITESTLSSKTLTLAI